MSKKNFGFLEFKGVGLAYCPRSSVVLKQIKVEKMAWHIGVFATGIFGVIVAMLLLGTLSAPIVPETSNSLTTGGIVLGFIVAIGAILTKFR